MNSLFEQSKMAKKISSYISQSQSFLSIANCWGWNFSVACWGTGLASITPLVYFDPTNIDRSA